MNKNVVELLPDDIENMYNVLNGYSLDVLKNIKISITQDVEFMCDEDYEMFLSLINPKAAMIIRICDVLIKHKEEAYKKV